MRARLAVGVGFVVAVAGVASAATGGGGPAEMVMWTLVALLPAGVVALGGLPTGYSDRGDD